MIRPDECLDWCEAGLKLDPQNTTLIKLSQKSTESKRKLERDKRKNAAKERKQMKEDSVRIFLE